MNIRVNFTLAQNGNLIVGTPYLRIKQKIPKEMFTKHGNVIHRNKRFQNSSPAIQLKDILNLEAKRNLIFPFSHLDFMLTSGHVWMWELDCEESWAPKNRCFWIVVLEKTLESPLDCKEVQPVHPKGNQSWLFIGRADAEAETPILWLPHGKSWLIGKDPDAGRDWGQEEKGTTEDEMAGWHHWLNGGESEWTPGVGDGQGSLACCGSWGHKESDMTERWNCTELKRIMKEILSKIITL